MRPNIANMHKTCYVFFSSYFCLNFYLYFFSPEVPERNPWKFFPHRSRKGTLEIFLLVFVVFRRLSSSFVVFRRPSYFVVRRISMGGSLRQTLDLSKTTNEKVPWRRPSKKNFKIFIIYKLIFIYINLM